MKQFQLLKVANKFKRELQLLYNPSRLLLELASWAMQLIISNEIYLTFNSFMDVRLNENENNDNDLKMNKLLSE